MTNRLCLIATLSIVFGSNLFAAERRLSFNSEEYLLAYSAVDDGVELREYLREGETLDSWDQMLSIQIHPSSSRVSDVMNPYAEARQSLYIGDVQIFWKNKEPGNENVIFQFLLKSPDDSYVELAYVRAVSKEDNPVILYVLSKKIPRVEESKMLDILNAALEKRKEWFPALGSMTLDEVSNQEEQG